MLPGSTELSFSGGSHGRRNPTAKRLGGMAEALSLASDLGFPLPPIQEDTHSLYNSATEDKSDDLIRVLRELTSVQRNIANLQVELQGRKDDKNVAQLTHVSEMEKKCESLARITSILKDVIQNKDRIIARLQQPYSLDCIPVEAEYQKQFSELLLKAASDYGALTSSVADFQWSQSFISMGGNAKAHPGRAGLMHAVSRSHVSDEGVVCDPATAACGPHFVFACNTTERILQWEIEVFDPSPMEGGGDELG